MRTLINLAEAVEPTAPKETAWDDLQTGVPALLYLWRGTGGGSTPLSDRWQARFGRRYLLGEGIYLAPTKLMAARFGTPTLCRVVLHNPYVIHSASGTTLLALDLEAVQQAHDGIAILHGRAQGNEDLRQVVVFPDHAEQVAFGIDPPRITIVQPGAKVRVNFQSEVARSFHPALQGAIGTVTSMAMGHPNVRIKGKSYFLSHQDVEVI